MIPDTMSAVLLTDNCQAGRFILLVAHREVGGREKLAEWLDRLADRAGT